MCKKLRTVWASEQTHTVNIELATFESHVFEQTIVWTSERTQVPWGSTGAFYVKTLSISVWSGVTLMLRHLQDCKLEVEFFSHPHFSHFLLKCKRLQKSRLNSAQRFWTLHKGNLSRQRHRESKFVPTHPMLWVSWMLKFREKFFHMKKKEKGFNSINWILHVRSFKQRAFTPPWKLHQICHRFWKNVFHFHQLFSIYIKIISK